MSKGNRSHVESLLTHHLNSRLQAQNLNRNILKSSTGDVSHQSKQQQQNTASLLNRRLANRPSPIDLQNKNILRGESKQNVAATSLSNKLLARPTRDQFEQQYGYSTFATFYQTNASHNNRDGNLASDDDDDESDTDNSDLEFDDEVKLQNIKNEIIKQKSTLMLGGLFDDDDDNGSISDSEKKENEKAQDKQNETEKEKEKGKGKDKQEIGRTKTVNVEDESDSEDSKQDNEINSMNTGGMGIHRADTWAEIVQPQKKHKKKERKWKKYVTYSFNLWFRLLSLIDFVTDLILLYKVMGVEGTTSTKRKIIPVAIALFVSIVSPYILSYSSGVKLGMFYLSSISGLNCVVFQNNIPVVGVC